MKRWIRTLRTFLGVYYAYMLEYRSEIYLWALAGVFPFILMGVWVRAAESGAFGWDPITFARYFLSVYLTRQLTVVWVIYEFEETVLKGTLSYYLLQPVPVVLRFVSSHLAERLARFPFMMGLVLLFFLLYPRAFWLPDPTHVLAFLVLVSLAFALRFLIQYTLSMLAFWTERAVSVDEFFFLAYLFLSGMIAPLEVFPEALRRVLLWTPFPYLVYTPARALVGGDIPWGQVGAVMLGWALVFGAVYRLLWTRGLHHYSGMGA